MLLAYVSTPFPGPVNALVHFPAWANTSLSSGTSHFASSIWLLEVVQSWCFAPLPVLCKVRAPLLSDVGLLSRLCLVMRTDLGCRCLPPLPFLGVMLIRFCTFASKCHCCRLHPRLLRPLKETHRLEPLSINQRSFWCPCLKMTGVCVT